MAVGLPTVDSLAAVDGVRVGTACAGIRYPDRSDLALFELMEHSRCAVVFTRNAFCAAPVSIARAHLSKASPRYLLINAGNANAGNGEEGLDDALQCCSALASETGVAVESVLPFSTGVIGERLPVERITTAVPGLLRGLHADGWVDAAHAIMTTDTVAKGASRQIEHDGHVYTVTGIAKGSGMIRPDMATMLAFIATNATVEQVTLSECLIRATEVSFNRITVDGDTSTNDACVLVATGSSGPPIETGAFDFYRRFRNAVTEVCKFLAQSIVRDAEGATKFVAVEILGGRSEKECLAVAYAIAHSPLVKTAFFAGDPNWGRILAAVGRASLPELDVNGLRLYLDDILVVDRGARAKSYRESAGTEVMRKTEFAVRVELGRGRECATVWTSDLSHDYVKINAEYRS